MSKSKRRRRVRRGLFRPSRRGQHVALAIVLVSVLAVGIGLLRIYRYLEAYPDRPGIGDDSLVEVEVPKGASFHDVLGRLVDAGVVAAEDKTMFKLFVLHRGAASRITAGKHVLSPAMTPNERLEELMRRREAKQLRITIPEGRNIVQVAEILAGAGLADAASWLTAMRDPSLLEELEIPGESVEGYLFPDTYRIASDSAPADVLRRLVRRHRQVYADLSRRHRAAERRLDKGLGWSPHEIVILASIVEKETAATHERPLIAGVFLNRLRFSSFRPKYLATDPTIIYGCTVPLHKSSACEQFEGRIRRIHLRDPDNRYNTYTHERLPPGPISNPGRAAIEAVLEPKDSRFLYFVSRNDGTHKFSRSRAEHEAAVDLYQRQGKVGG
ncbi:MAG: endolytic transglycosylase MltG [Myxococcales bacterium FL481]|nr:MAG: endolytic transglycosylase MltG [Myxococcales bacterium FL481]